MIGGDFILWQNSEKCGEFEIRAISLHPGNIMERMIWLCKTQRKAVIEAAKCGEWGRVKGPIPGFTMNIEWSAL